MKNIFKIFWADAKRLSTNVVAVVVVMGLSIIPSLYAWFNIFSNWDPYGPDSTSNMKIAVVSEDEGYSMEGVSLNVGDSVIEGLKTNNTIGWVFTDTSDEATDGVNSGEYYAALVIPEDFTAKMLSFVDGEIQHPEITYYENEKKNAIAPKITGKAKTAVQEQVNSTFISTLTEYAMKASNSVSDMEVEGNSILEAVTNNLTDLEADLQTYVNILNSFVSITDSASGLIDATQTVLPDMNDMVGSGESTVNSMQSALVSGASSAETVTDMVSYSFSLLNTSLEDVSTLVNQGFESVTSTGANADKALAGAQAVMPYVRQIFDGAVESFNNEETNAKIAEIQNQMDLITTDIENLSNATNMTNEDIKALQDKINGEISTCQSQIKGLESTFNTTIKPQLNSTMSSMQNSMISAQAILYGVDADFGNVTDILDDYEATLAQGQGSLTNSAAMAQELLDGLHTVIEDLNGLNEDEQYQKLMEIMKTDPELLGSFISSPVNLDTVEIYEIEQYGSAMAPFYTILALWVGALILVAIIHVHVAPEEGITNVKPYQQYFGRYITFFLIGQTQTLITVLGNLFYIKIQCHNPFLFWLAGAMSSFVFTLFIYSLTVAFGNIGEAIAIIVMVIQVAGAGGTFPIETLPKVYQMLYKYLPFPYGMNAMRETIGGMYQVDYWKCIGSLGIYIVVSLIIGLIVAIPFRKLNHIIEHSKEKSEVML